MEYFVLQIFEVFVIVYEFQFQNDGFDFEFKEIDRVIELFEFIGERDCVFVDFVFVYDLCLEIDNRRIILMVFIVKGFYFFQIDFDVYSIIVKVLRSIFEIGF